jgi:hypothetical protein
VNIDCAYYSRGVRQPMERMSLAEAAALPRRGGNFVWIELEEPSAELMSVVQALRPARGWVEMPRAHTAAEGQLPPDRHRTALQRAHARSSSARLTSSSASAT